MRAIVMLALLSGLLVPFCVPGDAQAQEPFNRRVRAASLIPSVQARTSYNPAIVWSINLDQPTSVPLNLSTLVSMNVNGVPVAEELVTVQVDPSPNFCSDGPACNGECGSGSVDGIPATMICHPEDPCQQTCDCRCGFLPITTPLPPEPLQPGDEIMVLLRPAPGALPDPNSTDDRVVFIFDGSPVFWNRGIQQLALRPSPGGPPGVFEVSVRGLVQFNGIQPFANSAGQVNLDLMLELQVNGIPLETMDLSWSPGVLGPSCFGQPCDGSCAIVGNETIPCIDWYPLPFSPCSCGGAFLAAFPAVPAEPGDEIVVILRPAPGALPELPGLPEDNEQSENCCPSTAIPEAQPVVPADWRLEQNRPNPLNPTTAIGFSLEHAGVVDLEIYDLRGNRVRTLLAGSAYESGQWSIEWDGQSDEGQQVASGVYMYRLTVDGQSQTRKMTVLK